jgi:4-hydroxy-tetrahydrodipicolinate synthase
LKKQYNMSSFQWKGVFPALLTPFDANDQVDLAMYEKNLDAQVEAGIHGIIIGGSLGEASTLSLEEKELLVRFSVKKLGGRLPIIMNIAEGSTKEAIQQAIFANEWGADGIMLLPPMRYKADDREVVEFFKAVAANTELPIMIYNNPVDYKIDVTLDMFEELSAIPHINAIKESTRDVTNITRLKNRFGDRFAVLCGVDPLTVEELALGADGLVAGLVDAFPRETVRPSRSTVGSCRCLSWTSIPNWCNTSSLLLPRPALVLSMCVHHACHWLVKSGKESSRSSMMALLQGRYFNNHSGSCLQR